MKKILAIIIIMLSFLQMHSQNTDSLVTQITRNNLTLKALAMRIKADSIGNRTDIYLQNPELGFNYLFGNQANNGNRFDLSVSQTFDFPSAYIYKSQISDMKNEQLQYSFEQQYREIVLQIKLICIDLVYYNLLIEEFAKRFENAEKLAKSYKLKFDIGETNIIEYNKAELNRLNTVRDLEKLQVEREALLNELTGLNGNIPVVFDNTIFDNKTLPIDFELWYSEAEIRNPILSWLKLEIELSKKQESLSFAMSLPKFRLGYMSEFSLGQNFQGISFGISLPLWENKNKNKYAALKTEALHIHENNNRLQYYNSIKALHAKAISMQKNIREYEKNLQSFNNSELLHTALKTGEIDLISYIMELSFYYDNYSNLLDMKRELQKLIAELSQY